MLSLAPVNCDHLHELVNAKACVLLTALPPTTYAVLCTKSYFQDETPAKVRLNAKKFSQVPEVGSFSRISGRTPNVLSSNLYVLFQCRNCGQV